MMIVLKPIIGVANQAAGAQNFAVVNNEQIPIYAFNPYQNQLPPDSFNGGPDNQSPPQAYYIPPEVGYNDQPLAPNMVEMQGGQGPYARGLQGPPYAQNVYQVPRFNPEQVPRAQREAVNMEDPQMNKLQPKQE